MLHNLTHYTFEKKSDEKFVEKFSKIFLKFFLEIVFWIQINIFDHRNFIIFQMAYCVKLCGMTQIKTAENQMSISQQCTNTIFIAKMYVKDSFLSLYFLTF